MTFDAMFTHFSPYAKIYNSLIDTSEGSYMPKNRLKNLKSKKKIVKATGVPLRNYYRYRPGVSPSLLKSNSKKSLGNKRVNSVQNLASEAKIINSLQKHDDQTASSKGDDSSTRYEVIQRYKEIENKRHKVNTQRK